MRMKFLAALGALALALFPAMAFAADNVAVTVGSGKTMGCKDISTVCYTQHIIVDLGGADISDTTLHALKTAEQTLYAATPTTTITRPADTNAYAADDAWADSTSAPTSGGATLSNACRVSGGSGVIVSALIVSSIDPATLLQGELWIGDSALTAVNDNAAFALSDADAIKIVPGGVIPFTLTHSQASAGSGTNSSYNVTGLNIAYTCSGTANLRFIPKVKNAYTPASAETLTVRLGVVGTN